MNLEGVCRKKFTELWIDRKELVVNGLCQDFSQYQYQVGYMKGMYDLYEALQPYLKDPDEMEMEEGR